LPEGFQRSEYLLEHGMVDMVVHRKDLRATLIRTLDLLMRPLTLAARDGDELDIPALRAAGDAAEPDRGVQAEAADRTARPTEAEQPA
ncbi:MAG TPA: acetyl-CoA carboxylase carboxyl transferase subunit beta, partial [Azospirillum sp.]|nr:acetyl-CoA carboxylase carboxyl transferase subunit beta [Azospirillum sp.]